MKFKKIFIVILMLSVFLSGCQRQVITAAISENKNDVSTSTPMSAPTNTSAQDTTPILLSYAKYFDDTTPEPEDTPTPIPMYY